MTQVGWAGGGKTSQCLCKDPAVGSPWAVRTRHMMALEFGPRASRASDSFVSLSLGFLICKMGMIFIPVGSVYVSLQKEV